MEKGKYIGFDKLKEKLADKPGVKDPAAIAAVIGRHKYGKERMAKAAARGVPITQVKKG